MILGAAIVVLLLFRLHAISLPLETDECNYAYIGGRLLAGDRLYEDVWDHQPPAVFVLFAAVIAVFGQSDLTFRLLAASVSVGSLVLLFYITRRAYGLWPAAAAAALFAVTSSDPGTAGEGCNREIYMNALALGSLALLTHSAGANRNRVLLAGLLLGLASAFKPVVAVVWLCITLWVAARHGLRDRRFVSWVAPILWMSAGPLLIWVAISAYFASTGRAHEFVDAVFGYNVGYSGIGDAFFSRFREFHTGRPYVFASAKPLWMAALPAALTLLILARRRLTSTDGAVLAFASGSLLAVCLPGKFWPHYYYLLLPPMILLCSAALAGVSQRFTSPGRIRIVRIVAAVWIGCVVFTELEHYLLIDPLQITAPRYDYRQQWARAQGRRIAELTAPDDTIFVWGKDAGVYHYSKRRCASRYTMVGALLPEAPGFQRRRDTLLRELKEHKPRIVLLVEPEFDELKRFLQDHYVVAGPGGLDRHDRNPEKIIMMALMDSARPVAFVDWEWRAPN